MHRDFSSTFYSTKWDGEQVQGQERNREHVQCLFVLQTSHDVILLVLSYVAINANVKMAQI